MSVDVSAGFAEVEGASLFYETAGEGAALVLVHAGIADRRMWDGQFGAFARARRVVRYDRRGFGRTRVSAAVPFSLRGDLGALLRHLDIARASLVGCSQGAKAVTDFALEHPEAVEALVLVAPALGGFEFEGDRPPQLAELERADAAGDLARVNELELQIWVDGPGRAPEQVDPAVRELVREMNLIALTSPPPGEELALDPPAAGRLREIRAPALVIVGDRDTAKTLAAADFIAANIRGARKVSMPGVAHLPNMERPGEFNRHVLTFLESL